MMRWKNTPESLRLWDELAASAPYRASVGAGLDWESDRPSPDLATVSKASRGGRRLLMAFELAATRDYFIDGHRGLDVRAEPDGASEAGPRRPPTRSTIPVTLDDIKAMVLATGLARRGAENRVERVFGDDVANQVAAGKPENAVRIIASMHDLCVAKARLTEAMVSSRRWDFQKHPIDLLEPMPFTPERAAAMSAWLRAHLDHREADDALALHIRPLTLEILNRDGPDALKVFADTLPPCMTRANLAYMAAYPEHYLMMEQSSDSSAPEPGSDPKPGI